MTHDTFDGVFPAMTTPFHDDESIDFERLREHAQFLEQAGVDGLVPMGTTGESATVTHDEHIEVVEAVVDAVDDVPVIAGSGSNNTREALDLSKRSADAGADGLLLISPYYNRPEPEGMEAHFRAIADDIDLPQIIYNVPSRTGRNIAVETAVNLAEHENIVGYKAASGDMNRITEVIERTRNQTFSILSGDDAMTLPIIATGGSGCISVSANVEPERTCSLVGAALSGDFDRARTYHHELGPLFRALFSESNPIPIKEAMEIRDHYDSGRMRSPLNRMSDKPLDHLREVLHDLETEPVAETTEAAE